MFTAGSIQANLGSTDHRYRLKLTITDASQQSTLALAFPASLQDGGSEIFFGAHQATASFHWGTCNVIPTSATVTLTSGDDPDAAFTAMSGMVRGTFPDQQRLLTVWLVPHSVLPFRQSIARLTHARQGP